ncbi:MAG: polysaccharide biosynthesis/export family protein [Halioglobus sp.]
MIRYIVLAFFACSVTFGAYSQESGDYEINPGDSLEVLVWNEETLTRQVIVRPDGFISLPLIGELRAGGQTPSAVAEAVKLALAKYLADEAVVTVSTLSLAGNVVYVLGKVNRPGAFPVTAQVDVTQALAWAGGLNTFADEKDIQVLRRQADGSQQAFPFNYADVKSGKKLTSNIILKSGDVVIVP